MKTRVHLKPMEDGSWGVYKFNMWENFKHDIRHWGIWTALYNVFYLIFNDGTYREDCVKCYPKGE